MESDGEIEYLDEDADIVQQYVQGEAIPETEDGLLEAKNVTSLLVERQPASKKKKRKIEEDDSDYDPRDDTVSPPINRSKKKKPAAVRNTPKPSASMPSQTLQIRPTKKAVPSIPSYVPPKNRKKMTIRIPDYDDPLCLPVRALIRDNNDVKKLKAWNNACISHLRHSDKILRPEKGITKGSSRTVVLRNFLNKETGKYETAVWAKTCVENQIGMKKSQNFQSVLPKFTEKTVLNINSINKKPKKYHYVDEVILTKEIYKNEESLVVYKPKECLSAVYKMIDQKDSKDAVDKEKEEEEEEKNKCLLEVACCQACAPCYQASWRGLQRSANRKGVVCAVCRRTFVSVYNLLAHVRAHSAPQVRAHRRRFAAELAKVVQYHYTCRVCQQQFFSIAALRRHVAEHKGNQMFICEIGNHMAS